MTEDVCAAPMLMRQLRQFARERSRCPEAAVGAAFYRGLEWVAGGFNGAPLRTPGCGEAGCAWVPAGAAGTGREHARHLHAEAAAIAWAARNGVALHGLDVMVTRAPCPTCALLLVAVGVARVWVPEDGIPDGWSLVEGMLVGAGIDVRRVAGVGA